MPHLLRNHKSDFNKSEILDADFTVNIFFRLLGEFNKWCKIQQYILTYLNRITYRLFHKKALLAFVDFINGADFTENGG